jgi:hypothetical protein
MLAERLALFTNIRMGRADQESGVHLKASRHPLVLKKGYLPHARALTLVISPSRKISVSVLWYNFVAQPSAAPPPSNSDL